MAPNSALRDEIRKKTKSEKSVFPQFLKILSSDFHQIWGISRGPQDGSLCQKIAKSIERILCKRGSKKFFSGGHTPKPEVELVGDEEGFCRAWGGVSDSEKFFGKFIETFGVTEKPLAPPSGKSRRQIFPKFGGSQGDPRADQ